MCNIDIWNGWWAHFLPCFLPADTGDIWPVLLLMGTPLSAICSTGEASIYEINLYPHQTIWSYQLIHLCLKILATRATWQVYCCLSVTAGKQLFIQHNIRCWIWFICLTVSCNMCIWTASIQSYDHMIYSQLNLICLVLKSISTTSNNNRANIELMSV